jgi:outer membrane protein assembly factor BamB
MTWIPRALICGFALVVSSASATRHVQADEVVSFARAEYGLFVCLGTTDGTIEATLAENGRRLVHGLTLDTNSRDTARRLLATKRLSGLASVEAVSDLIRLPYADRIVNVLIADLDGLGRQAPSDAEMKRVLAPTGRLVVRRGGKWTEFVQPMPPEMDSWTHWDHDPGGNPVSTDRLVGPTTSLRWQAGPLRGMHDAIAGLRLHQGRIVYSSSDEDLGTNRGHDGDRMLYCRDAFNGLLLWKRPVVGLRNRFAFVAEKGDVYTIVEEGGPVEALDIHTGETRMKFTDGTRIPSSEERLKQWRRSAGGLELPLSASHLILRRFEDKLLQAFERDVDVFDAGSGKRMWHFRDGDDRFILWCIVGDGKVFAVVSRRPLFPTRGSPSFLVDSIVALDAANGKVLWRQRELADRGLFRMAYVDGHLILPSFPTADGKIKGGYNNNYAVHKLRADTGEIVWKNDSDGLRAHGHYQVTMVTDGKVFVGNQGGFALDWQTGTLLNGKLDWSQYDAGCADLRACPGYTFYGLTFIDNKARVITRGQARSTCDVGNFPGYGLIYSTPSHCLCSNYVNGHLALAAEPAVAPIADEKRLNVGSAKAGDLTVDATGWPIHLGSPDRGAFVKGPGPQELKELWRARPTLARDSFLAREWKHNDYHAGVITAPTIAHGRLFVAVPDLHRLDSFDAASSERLWSFTAGARIDSPPTLLGSLAIFGCRDGFAYALRADTGQLVWKFQAAWTDKRMLVQSQLESAWPVSGSLLPHDGEIVVTAGRQSAIDHGIQVYRLDPTTGKLLGKTRIWTDPEKPDPVRRGYQPIYRRIQDLLVAEAGGVHSTIDTFKRDYEPGEVVELAPQSAADRGEWIKKDGDQMPWLWANSNGFLGRKTESQGRWDAAPMVYAQLQGQRFVKTAERLFMVNQQGGLEAYSLDKSGRPTTKLWGTGEPSANSHRPLAGMIGVGDRLYVTMKLGETTAIRAFAMANGKPVGQWTVDHPPLRDGLAAAGGKLYLATASGLIVCLGE